MKEAKWAKVMRKAVMDAKDVATIRTIVATKKGNLKVCVQSPYENTAACCLLTLAAWEGHTYLLPLLLEAGLSVEGDGNTVITPLIAAAKRGHAKMVAELLNFGANCLVKDETGKTALHLAAFWGHQTCVALLIPATLAATDNTPESIIDNAGCTPVHAAAIKGHWEVIQQLQTAGWDLYQVDKGDNTALHTAAWGGCVRLVKLLVAAGLTLNHKNKNGDTPLNIAVRQGNHEVEVWILKRQRGGRVWRPTTSDDILHLIRKQMEVDRITYDKYMSALNMHQSLDVIKTLLEVYDPHLVDSQGRTILHVMVEKAFVDSPYVLDENFGYHHALTYEGLTPLGLARRWSTRLHGEWKPPVSNPVFREWTTEAIEVLERHQCPKIEGSPEELYLKLLTVITKGDDAKEASRLLCAGAPLELTGDFPGSALQLAATNDRPRIVNLLLASGASLTVSSQGLSLLHQMWYSPNTTAKVYSAITLAFSGQLKQERDRLPRYTAKGLRDDLAQLIATIDGDTPWEAGWPEEITKKGKTERRTVAKLTSFMNIAVRANCPLTVSFLRWAGAWPFFSGFKGTTALHTAIKTGRLALVEVMVRDLGASLYIPDSTHCLPKDMEEMPADLLRQLELLMYRRERRRLEALANQQKDKSEKEKVEAVVAVQEALFKRYTGDRSEAGEATLAASGEALLIASRVGLLQLLYLLLTVAQLPPDTVVDVICGTTALHEAAAHGKAGCVVHLLLALQAAAAANAGNVAAIAAAATTTTTTTANKRLDRYSPLQPDRYGHTALHLAAMFGYKHTLELLVQYVGQDPLCQAGTDAKTVHENFTGYLRRYRRYDTEREAASPLDHWDASVTLKRLLNVVDLNKLPNDARKANVDFCEEGEARRVKEAVLREMGVILGRAAAGSTAYMGGRELKLRLVGSGRDGSKMFAPDEFDINVVVEAGDCVSVRVQPETDQSLMYKGHALRIDVETEDPHLQGEWLAENMYKAVSEALADCVLDERQLSLVPPGLTKTQVGVALSLAWQGVQYPLLLVGVDLVPVLEVPWHKAIVRPALTPPGASTMHLSATTDGSWRCSFAQLEAELLAGLSPEERSVQLSAKLLLCNLKTERWMPRRIKAFSTWWCSRSWNVPVPGSFCLKSSMFLLLEEKQQTGMYWRESDTILGVTQVFEKMCNSEDVHASDGRLGTLSPQKMKAYFGGDCEGPKDATTAPLIASHLRRFLKQRQRFSFSLHSLVRWCWWCWWRLRWRMAWLWKPLVQRSVCPSRTPDTMANTTDTTSMIDFTLMYDSPNFRC